MSAEADTLRRTVFSMRSAVFIVPPFPVLFSRRTGMSATPGRVVLSCLAFSPPRTGMSAVSGRGRKALSCFPAHGDVRPPHPRPARRTRTRGPRAVPALAARAPYPYPHQRLAVRFAEIQNTAAAQKLFPRFHRPAESARAAFMSAPARYSRTRR